MCLRRGARGRHTCPTPHPPPLSQSVSWRSPTLAISKAEKGEGRKCLPGAGASHWGWGFRNATCTLLHLTSPNPWNLNSRVVYEQLSKEPNSLANLDQDLPNYTQHQIPIFSLPQVGWGRICGARVQGGWMM